MRGVGSAFVHHLGGPEGHRAVDDVGVPGDPTDVGCAPIHIRLGVDVVHVLAGERDLCEIAAGGVEDALGLAGRAGGVEDEEGVLGVEGFGLVRGCRCFQGLVPPHVPPVVPLHLTLGALDHEDRLDGAFWVDCRVYGRLER